MPKKKTQEPVSQNAKSPSSDGPAKRVLLVEDYQPLAQTTTWALEMVGYEVHVAQNGPSAINLAKTFIPDVVLMDIGLPGMDGYELCGALRKQQGLEDTLFIAQTGWGDEKSRQLSREAGFDHHLVKPVDPEALENIFRSLDKSRKARRQDNA